MKATFIGGGSHRLLGILRGALAERAIFEGGEIYLWDLNATRAEAMARMVQKTPEFSAVRCRVKWGTKLGPALDGADMVGVILMAGSAESFERSNRACLRHGFLGSDNVSPSGAFLAMKGAPILWNIATQMQRRCPGAWLVDFANPIAVLSAMLNNHTPIRTLGVCAGYTNHQWDLSRIFGTDEQREYDVDVAGINHLSFILRGTVDGKELFSAIRRHIQRGWKMPRLAPHWPAAFHGAIPKGIERLLKIFTDLGVLIFSTEGDGMMHLQFDQVLAEARRRSKPRPLKRSLAAAAGARAKAEELFRGLLDADLDAAFWESGWQRPGMGWAQRQDRDIFVEVVRGLSGVKRVKVVTSRPNGAAVAGFSDRTVLEYSQIIERGAVRAAGRYEVPAVVQGMIASLASHQTLLGDALAMDDPQTAARALLSYPIQPFSKAARALYRELTEINRAELPPGMRRLDEYL